MQLKIENYLHLLSICDPKVHLFISLPSPSLVTRDCIYILPSFCFPSSSTPRRIFDLGSRNTVFVLPKPELGKEKRGLCFLFLWFPKSSYKSEPSVWEPRYKYNCVPKGDFGHEMKKISTPITNLNFKL